ncbi:MAG: PDDEXK nuclease domain-containing protein [Deltaproteobacteria bacterium]|jgi:predicted nuclease of restriction endonuclease-like (RecB) superfamily|nr:PDDEXK nuclease domain-containing protein [Deltaproteobacteria bacterium]
MGSELTRYSDLLTDIKTRIRQAQTKAVMSASAEMIIMYWDIGKMVEERQHLEGWGAAVIPRLSRDIRNDLPAIKGFSERNLKRMIRFYREYPGLVEKVPQAVALLTDLSVLEKLQQLVAKIPWGQNFLLIEKVKDISTRLWYMQKTIENGWSRDVLQAMIKNKAHERQGKAVTNFEAHLPAPQSDLAQQALKDPYIFDFLTLDEPFRERELDDKLKHETDNPSIGLILCQDKKKILAEYALRGMQKPIGISEYELTRALPDSLKSALPTIEEIEAELGGKEAGDGE